MLRAPKIMEAVNAPVDERGTGRKPVLLTRTAVDAETRIYDQCVRSPAGRRPRVERRPERG